MRIILHCFTFALFLVSGAAYSQMCSDYSDWNSGTTYHSGNYVHYGGKLYENRYDWNSSGEAPNSCLVSAPAWCTGGHQWYDRGGCSSCTDRTVGAASSSPSVCVNEAITSITHTTTEVTGIASSSGLPTGVSASYSSNTITISGTPSVAGTYNYTITPTSDCGSATATGTITVTALPTISGSVAGSRCNSGTVAIQATASAGSIDWYTVSSGGSSVGSSSSGVDWTTPSISTTTTYYAEAVNGSCVSTSRTAVTATVNTASTGPGGITDELFLWLKADAGTGSIGTSWEDQSCNGFDYSTVSGPTKETSDWNYNPAIEILSGGFDAPSGSELGTDWTVFFVSKMMASDSNGRLFDGHSGNYLWGYHGGYRNGLYINGSPSSHNSGIASTSGVTDAHIFTYVRESTGSTIDARIDGDASATYSSTNSASGIRIDLNQGAYSSESTDSRIGEFIIFNKELSDAEIMKVEAYLASKYGISLSDADGSTGGDYISTGGTTYWDASGSTSYNNDILVIGRDDATGLTQKQAKSDDDSLMVYISSLASDNSSNAGSITNDESFLVIGHNGGRQNSNATSYAERPSGIATRLEREWKISNTNFDDDFSLEIEWDSAGAFDISHTRLLVDDDGDFSDATAYSSADGLTFSIGSIIIGGLGTTFIPAGTTKYITVASASPLTTLPVDLLYFTATSEYESVVLNWETAMELNNDYFVIDKSNDGENWEFFSEIDGAGNSNTPIGYSYVDMESCEGTCYYRLTQVDFDGNSEVFKALVLQGKQKEVYALGLSVNPNPLQGIANVSYTAPKDGQYNFKILSETGQLVYSAKLIGMEGDNSFDFNAGSLKPSKYIFSISDEEGASASAKVIKN